MTKAVQPKINKEMLSAMREEFLALPKDITHYERARRMQSAYPSFSFGSLVDYSRVSVGCPEEVFALYREGKTSFGVLEVLCSFDPGMQKCLVAEAVGGKLGERVLSRIKQYLKEGHSVDTAVALATGKMSHSDLRKRGEKPRTLETLLDEIAKDGSKWRAKVQMAMDALMELEKRVGIYLPLFEKSYRLRHFVGEQWEFLDQKVKRYLGVMKRRAMNGGGSSSGGALRVEADGQRPTAKEESYGGDPGPGASGDAPQVGAHGEDGQAPPPGRSGQEEGA
ncbi:MAG: hypothetical protein ACRD1Z_09660 [Vicinamibacteria bacterium]